jgi:hypothetical protein
MPMRSIIHDLDPRAQRGRAQNSHALGSPVSGGAGYGSSDLRGMAQQGRVVGNDDVQDEIGSRVGRRLKGETRGVSERADHPAEISL